MYEVRKVTVGEEDVWDDKKLEWGISHSYQVCLEEDLNVALWLAEEFAKEHADRIGVDWDQTVVGGRFTTNNGTIVFYSARPARSS